MILTTTRKFPLILQIRMKLKFTHFLSDSYIVSKLGTAATGLNVLKNIGLNNRSD